MATEDIIMSAMTDAGIGGDDGGGGGSSGGLETPVSPPADEGATADSGGGETAATGGGEGTPPADGAKDPYDQILESHGFKVAPGRHEGRIPHSRVKEMMRKEAEKLGLEHQKVLKEHQEKISAAEQRLQNIEAVEELIRTDPEGFMHFLSKRNPAYERFVKPQTGQPTPPAQPQKPSTMPEPDWTGEDGSKGYTEKGLQKLIEWARQDAADKAAEVAEKKMLEQFGPMVNEWRAARTQQQMQPHIQRQRKALDDAFGADLIKTHEQAIAEAARNERMAAQRERRPVLPLEITVAQVLMPHIKLSQEQIEAKVHESIKKASATRRAAASTETPAQTANKQGGDAGESREGIIENAMRNAGLLG